MLEIAIGVGRALAATLVAGTRLRDLGGSGAKLDEHVVDGIVVQVGLQTVDPLRAALGVE